MSEWVNCFVLKQWKTSTRHFRLSPNSFPSEGTRITSACFHTRLHREITGFKESKPANKEHNKGLDTHTHTHTHSGVNVKDDTSSWWRVHQSLHLTLWHPVLTPLTPLTPAYRRSSLTSSREREGGIIEPGRGWKGLLPQDTQNTTTQQHTPQHNTTQHTAGVRLAGFRNMNKKSKCVSKHLLFQFVPVANTLTQHAAQMFKRTHRD